jgi:hypothetical protein
MVISVVNAALYLSDLYHRYASVGRLEKATLCHGTCFSTLYLMGKQEGEDKGCLLPFGSLSEKRIPVFAGECYRGISDGGVNRESTSWACIEDRATAIHYSKKFKFDPDRLKQMFLEIIEDTQLVLKGERTKGDRIWNVFTSDAVPFARVTYSGDWNQMILNVQQIKAWDEEVFNRELKDGLLIWIQQVKTYIETFLEKETIEAILKKAGTVEMEIKTPSARPLKLEDRKEILKDHPIVFITDKNDEMCSGGGLLREMLIGSKMKLGRDIRWIATETNAVQEVEKFISVQGLAKKVSVISFQKFQEVFK